jgi:hypothetical protein
LDERVLPSAYIAGNVAELIADINATNLTGGLNSITLVAGAPFQLSSVNNSTDGATGLPVIAPNNNLTISGNNDVIQRSALNGTPAFRIFDVALGATLTLMDVTLQGGLAFGSGVSAEGGSILNQGALNMNGVIIQQNLARSTVNYFSEQCVGGGIYSSGALTLQNCTIRNNQALGGDGTSGSGGGGFGDNALGGGIAIVFGSANLTNTTGASNTAKGGDGGQGLHGKLAHYAPDGPGGDSLGGGIYVGTGNVTLLHTSVNQNSATKGNGIVAGTVVGEGIGGGIYISMGALVGLDAFTLANVNHNHASTSDPNIYGSFSLL